MRKVRRWQSRGGRDEQGLSEQLAQRGKRNRRRGRAAKTVVTAGAAVLAAASLLASGTKPAQAAGGGSDPHWLAVADDSDGDYLSDFEEMNLLLNWHNGDQNLNGAPDGVELAQHCAEIIGQLPRYTPDAGEEPTETYVIEHFCKGTETCDICGEVVNMCFLEVVNPQIGKRVNVFFLAAHYMEHGSFSFAGSKNNGRTEVELLLEVLGVKLPSASCGHLLPVTNDGDKDYLSEAEEQQIGLNPGNGDENKNGIPDGVELAQHCVKVIEGLPRHTGEAAPLTTYVVEQPCLGIEWCDICGEVVNMCGVDVINPQTGKQVYLCYLVLHYMEHGSFSFAGSVNAGRADVPMLLETLEITPGTEWAHQLPVAGDADKDLLSNREERGLGYEAFKADQNDNGAADGVELAQRCAAVVRALPMYLPEEGVSTETYKIEHALDGVEQCDICGIMIHMGGWEIVNPKLGLRFPGPEDELDRMFLPDLALHYMEHGSFSCAGSVHTGRVDLLRLARVLEVRFPYEPDEHQTAPPQADLDGDFITDEEEMKAGYDLYDADQDETITPDGIELARQCEAAIAGLPIFDSAPEGRKEPYKMDHLLRGSETCGICGASVNMGCWLVVNPRLDLSMEVPVLVCHGMEHGSFNYDGSEHGQGRIDVAQLLKILEMPRACGEVGVLYRPTDTNRDCRVNLKDMTEMTAQWLSCTAPHEEGCEEY